MASHWRISKLFRILYMCACKMRNKMTGSKWKQGGIITESVFRFSSHRYGNKSKLQIEFKLNLKLATLARGRDSKRKITSGLVFCLCVLLFLISYKIPVVFAKCNKLVCFSFNHRFFSYSCSPLNEQQSIFDHFKKYTQKYLTWLFLSHTLLTDTDLFLFVCDFSANDQAKVKT